MKADQTIHPPNVTWTWHFLVGLGIALASLLAYSNSFDSPFFFDDIPNIVENEHIRVDRLSLSELSTALHRGGYISGRPLAFLTFAINYGLGEYDVRGYHLFNVSVHILNAILAYSVALMLLRRWRQCSPTKIEWLNASAVWGIATITALIFALHPLQVSSVTYIVQRMNLLATFFYLLGFALYLRGRSRTGRSRWTPWLGSLPCWVVAMLCKQNAATLPLAALLFEACFHGREWMSWWRGNSKRIAGTGILLAAVTVLLAVTFLFLLRSVGDVFSHYQELDFTMAQRVLTQFRVVAIYASLALLPWPSRFNLLHHVPTSVSLFEPITTLLAAVGVALYLGLSVWIARFNGLIAFCLLWVPLHLAVESSILPLEMIYEHRMYLPMFGVALLVSLLLFRLFSARWQWLRIPIGVGLATILGVSTHERNEVWRDQLTMWNDVIEKNPYEPRPLINRGGVYARRGDWRNAFRDYDAALKLNPRSIEALTTRSGVLTQYAVFLIATRPSEAEQQLADAIADCTAVLEILTPRRRADQRAKAHKNRAAARVLLARIQQSALSEAAGLTPGPLTTLALQDYSVALAIDPQNADCFFNRANLHRALRDYPEAIADYDQCLVVDPEYIKAYNNLAQLLLDCPATAYRNSARALELARKAVEISEEKRWELFETLASACSANNLFEEAANWQRQAAELAPKDLSARLRQKADQYSRAAKKRSKE